ncbi:MAG: acyl-[acyl-carrier-protein]--UDP-N-acetylglucosamine O-acyltransferase [Robiginitomaculum sp.]|nr:MAG: acyl-[acyl-carrier-protein]--UDP-N-acetylglucosamine O-acyltransferase [Robiginitomaculum sp.]
MDIHPTAIVSPKAEVGEGVSIGAYSIVESGAILGQGAKLYSQTHIGGATTLGPRCEVFPFAVLGLRPQDFKHNGEKTRLEIGADTIIREHVTMHPGTTSGKRITRVGQGGYFMVGSHVAHDCVVGDNVVFANNAALAGLVTVGNNCILGGLSAVHQNTRIGNFAFVGSMAMVTRDVIPYGSVLGNHAHLAGLNIVGLKRRNMPRKTIHNLRSAYRLLFADEGTFEERLVDVSATFASSTEVMEIVDFIREESARSLCMPHVR